MKLYWALAYARIWKKRETGLWVGNFSERQEQCLSTNKRRSILLSFLGLFHHQLHVELLRSQNCAVFETLMLYPFIAVTYTLETHERSSSLLMCGVLLYVHRAAEHDGWRYCSSHHHPLLRIFLPTITAKLFDRSIQGNRML